MPLRLILSDTRFGRGAIKDLAAMLDEREIRRVLLVTGSTSYSTSGAETALAPAMAGRTVRRFSNFAPNPQLDDLLHGLDLVSDTTPDAILAVGGGSVLDMAKLIGICAVHDVPARQLVTGQVPIEHPALPLIAVPTTAGSGSEATHFAVIYVDGHKYSVADPSLRPSVAIVDSALCDSLPPSVTAVSGLDTFCQAVESYWSVQSTEATRRDAARAIGLVLEFLARAVRRPDPLARERMSEAAHLAGRAIDVTKTTAAHAISYTMTSRFGIPHGHAVALTLGELLVYNSLVTDEDVTDPRGPGHVRGVIEELNALLGTADAEASRRRIEGLIESVGLATRLASLGIRHPEDHQLLVDNLNAERLRNNPRAVTPGELQPLLRRIA